MRVKPIEIIHSPFKSIEEAPIQPSRTNATGEVEIFREYQEGLNDKDTT